MDNNARNSTKGTQMLSRYKMYRGQRPPSDPLPVGIRQDTRKHTRHPLRPTRAMIRDYLADPCTESWRRFTRAYIALLRQRFRKDRVPFDTLAELAENHDVFLGCSCPTARIPDVRHCHTWLALEFMEDKYCKLNVRFPAIGEQ